MIVVTLIFAVISLFAMGFIANWAIGPLNRARTAIGAPTRFLITDIFWLMVLLQESLAFSTQFVPPEETEAFKLILGFLIFAAIVLWAAGVSFSSQAGVQRLLLRALIILVLLPGTLLVMIGIPAAVIVTGAAIQRGDSEWNQPWNPHYVTWAILIVGAIVLRFASTWVANRIFAEMGEKRLLEMPKRLTTST